jgi:hypothetical protein
MGTGASVAGAQKRRPSRRPSLLISIYKRRPSLISIYECRPSLTVLKPKFDGMGLLPADIDVLHRAFEIMGGEFFIDEDDFCKALQIEPSALFRKLFSIDQSANRRIPFVSFVTGCFELCILGLRLRGSDEFGA